MQENNNWKGPQFQESVNLYDLEKMPLEKQAGKSEGYSLIHWYQQVMLVPAFWFLGVHLSLIVEGSDLKIPSMSLAGKVDT